MIAIHLPIKTVSEANQREHFMVKARRKKDQTRTASLIVGPKRTAILALIEAYGGVVITLTRLSTKRLDVDNAYGSQKGTIDGIAAALGIDDGDARITWVVEQRSAGRGVWGVEMKVEGREAKEGAA